MIETDAMCLLLATKSTEMGCWLNLIPWQKSDRRFLKNTLKGPYLESILLFASFVAIKSWSNVLYHTKYFPAQFFNRNLCGQNNHACFKCVYTEKGHNSKLYW